MSDKTRHTQGDISKRRRLVRHWNNKTITARYRNETTSMKGVTLQWCQIGILASQITSGSNICSTAFSNSSQVMLKSVPYDDVSATLEIIQYLESLLDSKIHGANMGPTWGWQDPVGPHVGRMKIAISAEIECHIIQISAHYFYNKWSGNGSGKTCIHSKWVYIGFHLRNHDRTTTYVS